MTCDHQPKAPDSFAGGQPTDGREIQRRSYQIINERLAAMDLDETVRPIARRVIHATADFSFGESLRVSPEAVQRAAAAIDARRPIICDVRMLQAGITKTPCEVLCAIDDPDVVLRAKTAGCTRAAAAMELLADRMDGAIVAIGNAPTALWKVLELAAAGTIRPAVVVGLPVGFVGAAESKLALAQSDLCCVTNVGPRGGSPVAAAAVNALGVLAAERREVSSTEGNGDAQRPAIVLVAFGTAAPEARKVFDYIDATARRRYPEHDVRWAYTSRFVAKKLRRQGIEIPSLSQAAADLKRDDHASAVFQSFHIAPGQEYHEIREIDTSGLRIAVGRALLDDDRDITKVIEAIRDDVVPGVPNVIACHGNRRYPMFNRQLVAFAEQVESQYPNVVVCSILGQPGTAKLARARSEAARCGRVHFIPLMVVSGVHVMDDVLGAQPDSWKNIVAAKETTCAKPLGYRDEVLAVCFEHLDEALSKLNRQAHPQSKR